MDTVVFRKASRGSTLLWFSSRFPIDCVDSSSIEKEGWIDNGGGEPMDHWSIASPGDRVRIWVGYESVTLQRMGSQSCGLPLQHQRTCYVHKHIDVFSVKLISLDQICLEYSHLSINWLFPIKQFRFYQHLDITKTRIFFLRLVLDPQSNGFVFFIRLIWGMI